MLIMLTLTTMSICDYVAGYTLELNGLIVFVSCDTESYPCCGFIIYL